MSDASASHIITIPIASAVLEALTSVVFELLLLGALAILAQLVCAHYNLRRLYDEREPIKIGSPILPLRVHAPIGHLPLSVTLAVFLLIASLMNNLLSFSINGRSEPRFHDQVYSSLITLEPEARPMTIDYEAEYSPRPVVDGESQAPAVSARLRAVRMADQCTFCNYTDCTIYAYAFDAVPLNDSLVDPDAPFASTCVTTDFFAADEVWLHYPRFGEELSPTLSRGLLQPTVRQEDSCSIERVDASFASGESFADATLAVGECNLEVQDAKCFRRRDDAPDTPPWCAAVSPVEGGGLKALMFKAPRASGAEPAEIQWVTGGHLMSATEYSAYAANVAYLRAIEMSDSLALVQRMATATIRRDVALRRRDDAAGDRLLSDVDLRLAVPGVAFNVLLLVGLLVVDGWLYYSAVWSKRRQGFNTFSSVPDVLAVLSDDGTDRRRVDAADDRPGVAIQVEQPSLGVSRSRREDELERHITAQGVDADDWDELQIS